MTLKNLTETFVQQFADSTIYDRGLAYYKSGMVCELDYDPKTDRIQAVVSGNYGDYEVEITSDQGEFDAYCDCPYDGYPCKHIVAVMLTFFHNRNMHVREALERKKGISSLKEKIAALPKDELVEIILSCANNYPDLMRELRVRFEADKKITLSTIINQISKAFPSIESRNYYPSSIAKQLKAITQSIESAPDKIKVEVYWAEADRILAELNEYGMDDISLEDVATSALNSLVDCLVDNKSFSQRKAEIIEELMDYYTRGNCGITDAIYYSVEQLCSEKSDFQIVIDKLEAHFEKASYKSYYQDLLADLYKTIGDHKSQLKTLERNLQYGMDYWRLAQYWTEHRNKEKALQIVQEGLKKGEGRRTELYLYMQERYKKQNDYEQIFNLLKRKIQNNDLDNHRRLKTDATYRCLWQHSTSKNDYEGQVKLLKLRLNNKNIDLDLYKDAKKILNKADWSEFENRILTQLRDAIKSEHSTLPWSWSYTSEEKTTLAEIYEYKNDIENLLKVIKDEHSLMVKYEKKLLPLFPQDYLDHYRLMIDKLIKARGRDNYKTAVTYARVVKRIYQNILKTPEKWKLYIHNLRSHNKNLRAMQEEFAGL